MVRSELFAQRARRKDAQKLLKVRAGNDTSFQPHPCEFGGLLRFRRIMTLGPKLVKVSKAFFGGAELRLLGEHE